MIVQLNYKKTSKTMLSTKGAGDANGRTLGKGITTAIRISVAYDEDLLTEVWESASDEPEDIEELMTVVFVLSELGTKYGFEMSQFMGMEVAHEN